MSKNNNIKFPIGNEWLKVDLHIHSPIFNNCYHDDKNLTEEKECEIWEKFYTELNESGLDVIGINDYFTLEGYSKVKEAQQEGKINNVKLILPVIEFRTNTFVTSKKLNWHIIFDDTWSFNAKVNHINGNLKRLFESEDDKVPKACITDMKDEKKQKFKCEDGYCLNADTLDKFFNTPSFHNRMISVLSYNELRNALGKEFTDTIKLITNELKTKFRVEGLFTSSDSDTANTRLAHLEANETLQNLSLINCSDKHNFKGDFSHCNDFTKFSWMKTIPTFKGIQTAIRNYKDRIRFSEAPPIDRNNIYKTKTIESNIIISNHKIEFNQNGLISIIGNKSQGKSLLGTMIAQIHKDNEEALQVYKDIVTKDDIKFNDENAVSFIKCKLLSQNYIQKITQPNINGHLKELQKEIKRIIFSYDNDTQKKINEIDDNIGLCKQKINDLNKAFIDELKYTSIKIALESSLKTKIDEGKALEDKKVLYNKIINTKEYTDLDKYKQDISLRKQQIDALEKLQVAFIGHYKALVQYQTGINKFNADIDDSLKLYREVIKEENINNLDNQYKIEVDFAKLLDNIQNSYNHCKTTICTYTQNIKDLEDTIQKSKETCKKQGIDIESLQNVNQLDLDIINITQEIKVIKGCIAENENNLQIVTDRRDEHKDTFKKLFDLFAQKQKEYNGIIEKISHEIQTNKEVVPDLKNIGFEVKYNEDFFKSYVEDINNNCIDNRKYATVYSNTDLHSKNDKNEITYFSGLNQKIIESEDGDFKSNVDTLYEAICVTFINSNIKDSLKGEYKFQDHPIDNISNNDRVYSKMFLDKIFNINLDVHYNITYKKKPLNKLSHGERGTALTLIYLLLDIDYKDYPLVIDQPEDHIDSYTIQNSLVPAFKKAKESRQIFLITHNPNLVVNTDSDQVIIASTDDDKQFKYTSGSIDDKDIIKEICDILEGGKEAFKIRKNRYKMYIKDAEQLTKKA